MCITMYQEAPIYENVSKDLRTDYIWDTFKDTF